ncbi:PR domain zinc finger protein 5-like [Armigeres subalbatus]|uniref:PR domain zinc finger protein 5-like n=1 Tax=Armigeres subalbatus TaxID=124917 RepID=UPI002ED0BAB0
MCTNIDLNACRICFDTSAMNVSLTDIVNGNSLADMLRYCVNLKIDQNDELPYQCCAKCKTDLIVAYQLVIRCHQSDTKFRALVLEANISKRSPDEGNSHSLLTEDDIKTEFDEKLIYAEPLLQNFDQLTNPNEQKASLRIKNGSDYSSDDNFDDKEDLNDLSDVEENQNSVKGLTKAGTKIPERCCQCKIKVTSMEALVEHSRVVHLPKRCEDPNKISIKPLECDICFKRFTTKKAMGRHRLRIFIKNKYQCDECELSFKIERTLLHHKDTHRNVIQPYIRPKDKQPRCCACFKQFDTDELLKQHADEVHPAGSSSAKDSSKRFPCDLCHRRYKNMIVLREHQAKPYRITQYQCATCGRTFKERCYLTDHERTHQNEKSFVCPVCSKTFAMKLSYRRHVKTHSPGENRFKCEICGKGFQARTLLKRHSITHNPQHRPIQCTLCPATFAWKTCLQAHMKLHTGEKPHKCDQCGAAYAFSTDLKRHIMAHNGIKPYVCTICGRGYPRQDYLRKHMANHVN